MFCGNCGAELMQGVRFCGHCGSKVQSAPMPSAQTQIAQAQMAQAQIAQPGAPMNAVPIVVNNQAAPQRNVNTDWPIKVDLNGPCKMLKTGFLAFKITFHVRPDGLIWFENVPGSLFQLISFAWDGPNIVTETVSDYEDEVENQGRFGAAFAGGAAGAAIGARLGGLAGGAIGGSIGVVTGALSGNGNKKGSGTTVTTTTSHEEDSVADLTLRNIYTGEIGTVSVKGTAREIKPLQQLADYVFG